MPGNVQPRRVVLAAHDSLAVAGDVHVRARERARAEVDVGSVGGSEGLGRSPVGADLVQRRARGHVDASPRIEGDPVGAGRGQVAKTSRERSTPSFTASRNTSGLAHDTT